MPANTASPAANRQALNHVVNDALALAADFLQLLEREKRALGEQNVAGIEDIARAKFGATEDLEALEQRRQTLCVELLGNAAPSREQMNELLDDGARWSRFCELMHECHDANAINGRLIQLRRRHVARALCVLGGDSDTDAGVYGPTGEAAYSRHSHVLGSA